MTAGGTDLERTAGVVCAEVDAVFEGLEAIAGSVARAVGAMESPRRGDFSFLKRDFSRFVHAHRGLIVGAGIAYAPGSLPETPYWLEWWRAPDSRDAAETRFVTHDLNPESLTYYDYTVRDWFTIPASHGRSVAVGPYVDVGGINVSIITLSVPVATAQGTHVLGADLALAKLEGLFLRTLRTRRPSVLLLGPDGRVLASNDPRFASGVLYPSAGDPPAAEVRAVCPAAPSRLPWELVRLGP